MTVTELAPNNLVVWKCHGDDPDWADTTLVWELRPQGEHAEIKFTHADWKVEDDQFTSSNTTWGMLMYRLKDYLEGTIMGPRCTELKARDV